MKSHIYLALVLVYSDSIGMATCNLNQSSDEYLNQYINIGILENVNSQLANVNNEYPVGINNLEDKRKVTEYVSEPSIPTKRTRSASIDSNLTDATLVNPELSSNASQGALDLSLPMQLINNDHLLFQSMLNERFNTVQYLIENNIVDVNVSPNCQYTPLIYAIALNKFDLVKYFVERGANVNAVINNGFTAQYFANKIGKFEIEKYLINHGAVVINCPIFNYMANQSLSANITEVVNQFIKAIKYNDKEKAILIMIYYGLNINYYSISGVTPLLFSVAANNEPMVNWLLKIGADISCTRHKDGANVLHLAVKNKNLSIIKTLCDHDADPNGKMFDGNTPLHLAAEQGLYCITKYLVEHDADINVINRKKQTPVQLAIAYKKTKTVDFLNQYRLFQAIRRNDLDTFKDVIVSHKISPNMLTPNNNSLLHLAVQSGNLDIVKYLVFLGANIYASNANNETPLIIAKINKQQKIADFFSKFIIFEAIKYNNLIKVNEIISSNKDYISIKTEDGSTPLHFAAQYGQLSIVKYLTVNGANIEATNDKLETPLKVAISNNKKDVVKFLYHYTLFQEIDKNQLEKVKQIVCLNKININVTRQDGLTPLHFAAQKGYLDIVKYLVEHKANLYAKNSNGETPKQVALLNNHIDVASFLADYMKKSKESNINIFKYIETNSIGDIMKIINDDPKMVFDTLSDGTTPLHLAAKKGYIKIAQYLINHKANVNAIDDNNQTPLQVAKDNNQQVMVSFFYEYNLINAIKHNMLQQVQDLINENQIDINIKMKKGITPLHLAVKKGALDIVKVLVEHGANLDAQNDSGETPLQLAKSNNRQSIVKYLITYMQNQRDNIANLFEAIENDSIDKVAQIIETNKVDINFKLDDGTSPLHLASQLGYLDIVQYLINHNADIQIKNNKKLSPLQVATENNQYDIVELFYSYMLFNAIERNYDYKIIKSLICSETINVNFCMSGDVSLLHLATQKGNLNLVKELVKNKANIYVENDKNETPLQIAIANKHQDIVEFFNTIEQENQKSIDQLMEAVRNNSFNEVNQLISSNQIDVNIKSKLNGMTALHMAIKNNNLPIVKLLAAQGAKVYSKYYNDSTALEIAQIHKRGEIVQFFNDYIKEGRKVANQHQLHKLALSAIKTNNLTKICECIEFGADINNFSSQRMSLLFEALLCKNNRIAMWLLKNGANIFNRRFSDKASPLYIAIKENCDYSVIKYMIDAGAHVNIQTTFGFTPLHAAVQRGSLDIVKDLIEKGARLDILSNSGISVLQLAVQANNLDIIDYIKNYSIDHCQHLLVSQSNFTCSDDSYSKITRKS